MKKLFLIIICYWYATYIVQAQNTLPDTDIFICDVELKNGKYSFTNLKNITNREGYDNQPSFIDNNTILYTSIREDKQADVYKYDLKTGKITQITNSPEDEYSPTLMPDGKHISTVRVEKDSTQRLWKFPLANPDSFSFVLPDFKGVGYHQWIDDQKIALFMLGNPFTLQIATANKLNNEHVVFTSTIDSFIGRSISIKETSNYSFSMAYTSKRDTNQWFLMEYNNVGGDWNAYMHSNSKIIALPKNSEDFVFGPNKSFWIGNEKKLLCFDPAKDKRWIEIFDFKGTPAENFYRIAFSPDGKKLALVSYVGKKP